VTAGTDPTDGAESLNDDQLLLEQRYLGLRTDRGVPLELVPEDKRTLWQGQGWAEEVGDRIRLTPEGWLRLDALVAGL
jgi:coproporphyrinogen III oxidase-like Fe-S oxidoreductase